MNCHLFGLVGFYGMSTLIRLFYAEDVSVLFFLCGVWLLLVQFFVFLYIISGDPFRV